MAAFFLTFLDIAQTDISILQFMINEMKKFIINYVIGMGAPFGGRREAGQHRGGGAMGRRHADDPLAPFPMLPRGVGGG